MAYKHSSWTENYHKEVAEDIIKMLEEGTPPWHMSWDVTSPQNGATGKRYRGMNNLRLSIITKRNGYTDPRWMTFKQIQDAGGKVKPGSKGTHIEYWMFEDKLRDSKGKPVLDENGKCITVKLDHPMVKGFTVFNLEQTEGLPPYVPIVREFNPIERADDILNANGVPIYHDETDSNYYSPMADEIHLTPRTQFHTTEDYYATALHEVAHSTGHSSRLGRDQINYFGSPGYAKEELRAEISSFMLCSELGINNRGLDEQHAAYVGSWIQALKNDYNEIFRAAADAEKICTYLLDKEAEYVKSKDVEKEKESVFRQAVRLKESDEIEVVMEKRMYQEPSKESEQKLFKYYLDRRPADIGAIPTNGLDHIDEKDLSARYGAVYYTRELTADELYNFELTKAADIVYKVYTTNKPEVGKIPLNGLVGMDSSKEALGTEIGNATYALYYDHELDKAVFSNHSLYKSLDDNFDPSTLTREGLAPAMKFAKDFKKFANLRLSSELKTYLNNNPGIKVDENFDPKKYVEELINSGNFDKLVNERSYSIQEIAQNISKGATIMAEKEAEAKTVEQQTTQKEAEPKEWKAPSEKQIAFAQTLGMKLDEIKEKNYSMDDMRKLITKMAKEKEELQKERSKPANEKQIAILKEAGKEIPDNLTSWDAGKMIYKLPPSEKQIALLKKYNVDYEKEKLNRGAAAKVLKEHLNKSQEQANLPPTDTQMKYIMTHKLYGTEIVPDGDKDKVSKEIQGTITRNEAASYIHHHMVEIEERKNGPITEKQAEYMKKAGMEITEGMNCGEAAKAIHEDMKSKTIISEKQREFLTKRNVEISADATRESVSKTIGVIVRNENIANCNIIQAQKHTISQEYQRKAKWYVARNTPVNDKKIAADMLVAGYPTKSVATTLYNYSPNCVQSYDKAWNVIKEVSKNKTVQAALAKYEQKDKAKAQAKAKAQSKGKDDYSR